MKGWTLFLAGFFFFFFFEFVMTYVIFSIFNVGKKLVTVSCAVTHRHHIEVTLWSTAFHDYCQSTFRLVGKIFVFSV